jgi:hypothetical protein
MCVSVAPVGIENIEMMWDDVAEAEDRGRKGDFHCVLSVDMTCTVRYRLRGSAQHVRNVGKGWAQSPNHASCEVIAGMELHGGG